MLKVIQSGESSEIEVVIFSKKNQLTEDLVGELQRKDCRVTVCDFKIINSEWSGLNQKIKGDKHNKQFYFLVIIEDPLNDPESFRENIKRILNFAENVNSKTLFVLPRGLTKELIYYVDDLEKHLSINRSIYSGTIFLGDLISPDFSVQSLSQLDEIVKKSINARSLILPSKEMFFYPLLTEDASKFLVASLFSMSSYRKRTQILGEPVSAEQLANLFFDFRDGIEIRFTDPGFVNPRNIQENRYIKFKMQDFLAELHKSAESNRSNLSFSESAKPLPQKFVLGRKAFGLLAGFRKGVSNKFRNILPYLSTTVNKTTRQIYKKTSLRKFNKPASFFGKFKEFFGTLKFLKRQRTTIQDQNVSIHLTDEMNAEVAYSPNATMPVKSVARLSIRRKMAFFCLGTLLIMAMPFLSYLISNLLFAIAGKSLKTGNLQNAETFTTLSGYSASISQITSFAISNVPVAGRLFQTISQKSNNMGAVIDINTSFLKVVKSGLSLIDSKSLNGKSTRETVKDLSLEIKSLYEKLSFWETDSNNGNAQKDFYENPLFGNVTVAELRSKLLLTQRLLDQTSVILGESKPVNYLLLLQNNDVIKPTGGSIESFAVLTLSAGEVTNLQFFDTEDLDLQPKVELEAPLVLGKYFNKKYLKFEDTNIYSDFTLSAQKAEWYLDKILNLPIDGVIALDRDLLAELGSVDKDSNTHTGAEGEGTKVYFESFFDSLSKGNTKDKLVSLLKLERILNRKQIILFLNDTQAQKVIDDLGWNGSVKTANCADPCYKDVAGLAELTEQFGSNNLERELDLEVSFQENLIKRKLEFFVENKNDFVYKTYIKLIANSDSGFSPVKVSSSNESLTLNPEIQTVSGFKEAGVYTELQPKETKVLSFTWESGMDGSLNPRYSLLIRRQPGIKDYVAKLRFNKQNLDSLTDEGSWDYNTLLSSDFVTNLSLEEK